MPWKEGKQESVSRKEKRRKNKTPTHFMRSITHQKRIHVFKQRQTSVVTENIGLLGCQKTEGGAKWKIWRDKRKD